MKKIFCFLEISSCMKMSLPSKKGLSKTIIDQKLLTCQFTAFNACIQVSLGSVNQFSFLNFLTDVN